MEKKEGRKGLYNEYIEYSNGGTAKIVMQKSTDIWYVYFLNRKTTVTLGNDKRKKIAEKLTQIAAKVYFDICS